MALLALHALALFLFENDDLLATFIFENGRGHACAGEDRGTDLEGIAFTGGEYLVDLNGRTGFRIRVAVYDQDITFGYGELLPLRSDGRFHK